MYGLQNEYELQRLQQSSKDSRSGPSICVAKSSRLGSSGAAAGAAGAGLESKAEQGLEWERLCCWSSREQVVRQAVEAASSVGKPAESGVWGPLGTHQVPQDRLV